MARDQAGCGSTAVARWQMCSQQCIQHMLIEAIAGEVVVGVGPGGGGDWPALTTIGDCDRWLDVLHVLPAGPARPTSGHT
jgi:hypothetical protein